MTQLLEKGKFIIVSLLILSFVTSSGVDALAATTEGCAATTYAGVTKVMTDNVSDLSSETDASEGYWLVASADYSDGTSNSENEESFEVVNTTYTRYSTVILNIREQPNTDSEILGKFGIKDEVTITGEITDSNWVRISYYDQVAYVCADYLAESVEDIESSTYNYTWSGEVLNRTNGKISGPSGNETYYNLDMSGCISIMESLGYDYKYWVRDDGVKMYGDYVMVAADLSIRPKGSLVETSLGTGIVVDTGGFVSYDSTRLDVAVAW